MDQASPGLPLVTYVSHPKSFFWGSGSEGLRGATSAQSMTSVYFGTTSCGTGAITPGADLEMIQNISKTSLFFSPDSSQRAQDGPRDGIHASVSSRSRGQNSNDRLFKKKLKPLGSGRAKSERNEFRRNSAGVV